MGGEQAADREARTEAVVSLLAPPQSVPVAVALADRIVTAIAVGEFQPGQRLPAERELSAQLGLSRNTVREALARVARLGMLDIRRGRTGGAYVTSQWTDETAKSVRATLEPLWAELVPAFDMRKLVESLVAATAAERRDPDDSREIMAALHEYESAPDLAAAQLADLRLHNAVAHAAKNPRLIRLREDLLAEVSIGFSVEPFTPAGYAQALPEHRSLAEAVVEGDAVAAARIGSQHFGNTEDELRDVLRRAVEGAKGSVR
jgi:GntR family transcriptional regulator, transcriptional repressor for pyruvate dehydrogenase complex